MNKRKCENRKIKVCFILFDVYPLFNKNCREVFGGAEVDLYNLALKLAEDPDYDIAFIVGDYGQADVEFSDGIKVVKLKYENKVKKSVPVKLRAKIEWVKKLFLTRADIYFTESASELLGWLVLINKMIKRKRVVFRLASDVNTDLAFYKKSSKRFYYFYKFGLLLADWVVSQTEAQRSRLEKNLNVQSTVLKNGFIIPNENRLRVENKKHILWVARCIPLKRPEIFVELARRLPEENFVLIMPSYAGDKSELEQYNRLKQEVLSSIAELANLKYLQYVPYGEITRYYEEAKLLVNTSEYEGFPNTFIQACLGKTPILSFKVDPDQFITENEVGHVCGDSIESAENFIKNLDLTKIHFYGENAFQYVQKHHNLEVILHDYKENFKKLTFD